MVLKDYYKKKINYYVICYIVFLWVEDFEGGWQQEFRLEGDIDIFFKFVYCYQFFCLLGGLVQGIFKYVYIYRVDYIYLKNVSIFFGINNSYMLKLFILGKD